MNRADRGAAIGVSVIIDSPSWRRRVPRAKALTLRCARLALEAARARGPAELAIVLAGDSLLRRLNRRYRGKDKPTNVLAFAGASEGPPDAPRQLGDVAIALGVAAREARAAGRPLADHLAHLVMHGVLHLLGHDHVRPADARRMESLETALLERLGVPDPHRPPARA